MLLMRLWSAKSLRAIPAHPWWQDSFARWAEQQGWCRGTRRCHVGPVGPPQADRQAGITPSPPLTLLTRVWGSRAALGEACVCAPRAPRLHCAQPHSPHQALVSSSCLHREQLVLQVRWPQAMAVTRVIGHFGDWGGSGEGRGTYWWWVRTFSFRWSDCWR